MSSKWLSFLILAICAYTQCLAIREQAAAVRGVLKCGDAAASGVHVKLWDEDEG